VIARGTASHTALKAILFFCLSREALLEKSNIASACQIQKIDSVPLLKNQRGGVETCLKKHSVIEFLTKPSVLLAAVCGQTSV
jgi:hypothetical protein